MVPIITIITACYNSEATIEQTVESVLAQTYPYIQFILIDGCSKDRTVDIIKLYTNRFRTKNIDYQWISEQDKGIYDAWNKGIKLAKGDWISFVGSDDILLPNAIKSYVDLINKNEDINFISSKILWVNKNLNPIKIKGEPWSNKMQSYCCIAHVGSLHHKCLFTKTGLFDISYKSTGDYDFLLRCNDIIKPLFLPSITVKVRIGGISQKLNYGVIRETLQTKIANTNRPRIICYIEHWVTFFKSILRIIYFNSFGFWNK